MKEETQRQRMKPERSERVLRETKTGDGFVFTAEVRELIADFVECAFLKVLGFVTRLWAPKTGDEKEGGDDN